MSDFKWCNRTELIQLIRGRTPTIPGPDTDNDRLEHLAEQTKSLGYSDLQQAEMSGTTRSRAKLETWVQQNFTWLEGQLPCTGPTKGRCTLHGCPESQHLRCFLNAEKKWC